MKMKTFLITFIVSLSMFVSAFFITEVAISKCSKSVTKGKNLYVANCQSCHGNKGKIHRINRESRRSFMRDVLGSKGRSDRQDKDNENGENERDFDKDSENASGSSSMPGFKGTLKKSQVNSIYRYLKKPKKACNNGGGNNSGGTTNPTYSSDISSLLSSNCTACHNSSSAAKGVALDTYADAVSNASAAKTTIDSGTMPPGGSLSASLVSTFDTWVANGTPQ